MNPTRIKEPRLSEDSSTESSTSASAESETDRQTDDDTGSVTAPELWATEEEFMAFANTIPEIAGRYTDADPVFRDDEEMEDPPIVEGYAPRKYDNRSGGGGYQNRQNQHSGHYNQHSGYNYHQGQSQGYHQGNNYYRNNRQGGRPQDQYRNQRPYHPYNRYEENEEQREGRSEQSTNEASHASRGQKRKTDHSHSQQPDSEFYARPIGNKHPRSSYQEDDDDAAA